MTGNYHLVNTLYLKNDYVPLSVNNIPRKREKRRPRTTRQRKQTSPTMLATPIRSLLLNSTILILAILSTHARNSPSHSIRPHQKSLFAIRGGAFFGFGRNKSQNNGGSDDPNTPKRFPALTKEEIEDKLSIPIYGITDLDGNGVILSDGGEHIFHFFLNRNMAEQASRAVSAANNNAPELKVSAFHLGKCWFKLIECSGERMFTLSKCGEDKGTETSKPIHFRLVPNMKGECYWQIFFVHQYNEYSSYLILVITRFDGSKSPNRPSTRRCTKTKRLGRNT
jgi:hypothetical protein